MEYRGLRCAHGKSAGKCKLCTKNGVTKVEFDAALKSAIEKGWVEVFMKDGEEHARLTPLGHLVARLTEKFEDAEAPRPDLKDVHRWN